jgi:WD40 repeat protein
MNEEPIFQSPNQYGGEPTVESASLYEHSDTHVGRAPIGSSACSQRPSCKGRCCGFSPDGAHLAVGCAMGGLHVLDAQSLQRVHWAKTFQTAIADVKYSPDGRLLAAGAYTRPLFSSI